LSEKTRGGGKKVDLKKNFYQYFFQNLEVLPQLKAEYQQFNIDFCGFLPVFRTVPLSSSHK